MTLVLHKYPSHSTLICPRAQYSTVCILSPSTKHTRTHVYTHTQLCTFRHSCLARCLPPCIISFAEPSASLSAVAAKSQQSTCLSQAPGQTAVALSNKHQILSSGPPAPFGHIPALPCPCPGVGTRTVRDSARWTRLPGYIRQVRMPAGEVPSSSYSVPRNSTTASPYSGEYCTSSSFIQFFALLRSVLGT